MSRRAAAATIPFYARFEELLAQIGRERPPGETPREWLTQLTDPACFDASAEFGIPTDAPRPPPGPTPERFAAAAREIIEAFYRVRYSRAALDHQQLATLEQSLHVVADFVRIQSTGPSP